MADLMALTTLGRSGLQASLLGLGLAAVGRPAYINLGHDADVGSDRSVEGLRTRSEELLDAAYAAGLRYFDAARSYGRAEEFLAGWLSARGLESGQVTVGSKWGYTYTGGWRIDAEQHEVKDLSAGALRRQLAETRSLLGDHLSLYQIHSATLEAGEQPPRPRRGLQAGHRAASRRAGGASRGLLVAPLGTRVDVAATRGRREGPAPRAALPFEPAVRSCFPGCCAAPP